MSRPSPTEAMTELRREILVKLVALEALHRDWDRFLTDPEDGYENERRRQEVSSAIEELS